jgi:hypothetical protein
MNPLMCAWCTASELQDIFRTGTVLYWYDLVFWSHVLEEKRSRRTSRPSKYFEECDICFFVCFFLKIFSGRSECCRMSKMAYIYLKCLELYYNIVTVCLYLPKIWGQGEEIWEMSLVPLNFKELSNPSGSHTSHRAKSWSYQYSTCQVAKQHSLLNYIHQSALHCVMATEEASVSLNFPIYFFVA